MDQKTRRSDKALGDKYIARIQLDRDMGAIFEWVAQLQPSNRPREIMAALRLGFAVQSGRASLGAGGMLDIVSRPPSPDLGTTPSGDTHDDTPSDPIAAAVTRDQQALMDLGFDRSFFTPPSAAH